MSPWVRIDEHALNHVKILALSHGAFRLWVEGLAHCQKHLTDGLITRASLKGFRYRSSARAAELSSVTDGLPPLWEPQGDDYLVHDYLQWNNSKEKVLHDREVAATRIRRLRSNGSSNGSSNGVTTTDRSVGVTQNATGSPLSGVSVLGSSLGSEVKERGVGKTIEERASVFNEWYQDTHLRLFGIAYMGANNDWPKAMDLCRKFEDVELRDSALVWFGMDDEFTRKGNRTITKFAARMTECLQRARATA